MSIALMTMVWKTSLPSGQKMVLLALCDNANDQGECYPSVTMLAEKCSMGERTVQQHIADLEAAGIVTREMRTGRSTMYHINPRKICTPAKSAPPQISHPTPADSAPITINEPSIESSRNRQRRAKPVAIALPDWLPPDVWQSWVEYRKSIKAPLTDKAASLCLAKLMKLREAGQDPVSVIDQSIMSGKWTGLFPVKDDLSQQSHAPKRSSEARGSEPVRLVAGRDYV